MPICVIKVHANTRVSQWHNMGDVCLFVCTSGRTIYVKQPTGFDVSLVLSQAKSLPRKNSVVERQPVQTALANIGCFFADALSSYSMVQIHPFVPVSFFLIFLF